MVADIIAQTRTVDMRPEVELLLSCARTYIDPKRAERIKTLLQEDIDWDYLLRTARLHGVIPLLYHSLDATCPEAVPKARLAQLCNYFHTNARRSFFLTGELLKVLHLFEAHGIRVIPYKGPVLASSVYGKLMLRQFCDLDILIHKRDVLRTQKLLISQGYQLKYQRNWEYHFVTEDSKVNLDLHYSGITPREHPFPLDFDRLWKRLEPVSLASTTVLNLNSEDLLLILCVQVTKDCWQWTEKLAKICDIAEVIRVYPGMDWNRLIKQASNLGSERMLFLGLLLAHDLLGIDLPEEILRRIQTNLVVKALAKQVCGRLFGTEDRFFVTDGPPKYLDTEKILFYLRVRERLQDKVPYFLHLVKVALTPTSADRAFLPLFPSLWFLYYLVRPIRISGNYILSLLQQRDRKLS